MLKSDRAYTEETVHYYRYEKTFRLFCAGGSLHDMITNSPEISKQSAPDFTLQILEGLIYLHTEIPQFIIHGDLKSQNVFLTENRSVLKIGDLDGHIRMKGPQTLFSDVSTPVGTPCFMSPEMVLFSISKKARVPIGRRTDIWSLGCIVLDMVCGGQWTINGVMAWSIAIDQVQAFYSKNVGGRPDLPSYLDPSIVEFLELCLRWDMTGNEARLDAKDLVSRQSGWLEENRPEISDAQQSRKQDYRLLVQFQESIVYAETTRKKVYPNEIVLKLQASFEARQKKVDFVNSLNLQIHQTYKVLLAGTRGWEQYNFANLSFQDDRKSGLVFTIFHLGLDTCCYRKYVRHWSLEEVLKLSIILIYEGIPRDLIVVNDGDIESLVAVLDSLGIQHPMIAFTRLLPIMAEDPNRKVEFRLSERVNEVTNVLRGCDESSYFQIVKDKMLGTPITYPEDISAIVTARASANVCPFRELLGKLGARFVVPSELGSSDSMMEALFQFVYVFEKKYKREQDHFMSEATLFDFWYTE